MASTRYTMRGRVAGVLGTMVLAAGVAASLPGSASASAAGGVSCHVYTGVRAALAAGEPASYTIAGELCATPAELANGETVQLLIHGATYDHNYWDFGAIDGVSYSYARDVAAAGYPTFAIDEIGAGQSSQPPSTDITIQVTAYVAHEVVRDLLGGEIGHTRFGNVILVGHSQGSLAAWVEAATYNDVAGVIITGLAHSFTALALGALGSDLYPAIDDPAFANSGLDSGYLTTVPGTRTIFHNTADSDPSLIARDEATKGVVSGTLMSEDLPLVQSTLTQRIVVPLLVILGSEDRIVCGTDSNGATFDCSSGQEVATEEAPYYSTQAQLRACVVPGSGHDLNLALNHDLEEADALAWSYEQIGQQSLPPVPTRVLPPDCSSS